MTLEVFFGRQSGEPFIEVVAGIVVHGISVSERDELVQIDRSVVPVKFPKGQNPWTLVETLVGWPL